MAVGVTVRVRVLVGVKLGVAVEVTVGVHVAVNVGVPVAVEGIQSNPPAHDAPNTTAHPPQVPTIGAAQKPGH